MRSSTRSYSAHARTHARTRARAHARTHALFLLVLILPVTLHWSDEESAWSEQVQARLRRVRVSDVRRRQGD